MLYHRFVEDFKTELDRTGLTLYQAARASGVDVRSLYRWLSQQHRPREGSLLMIERAVKRLRKFPPRES